MEYQPDKLRGVLDKSFVSVKVPFHKDCMSKDMLKKCQENVWGTGDDAHYTYLLADGSGTVIGETDFNIDLPSGERETLPWLLANYLRVSNIRYLSRLRLYCMGKL